MKMHEVCKYISAYTEYGLDALSENKVIPSPQEYNKYPEVKKIVSDCVSEIASLLLNYISKLQSDSTSTDIFSVMVRESIISNIFKVRDLRESIISEFPETMDKWWNLYNPSMLEIINEATWYKIRDALAKMYRDIIELR